MTTFMIRPRWGRGLATAALLAAGWLSVPGALFAEDRIQLIQGSSIGGSVLSGDITAMSADFVTIDVKGDSKKVRVDEITEIQFDKEPLQLRQVRNRVEAARWEDGLREATSVDQSKFEGSRVINMQQDQQFYAALCITKLAFENAKPLEDAEKLLTDFAKAHPGSYHILQTSELLGDIETALGKYPEAEKAYQRLVQSTLDSYKLRGAVLVGFTQLKQNNTAEALKSFDEVVKASGTTPAIKRQVFLATLGKASCIIANGKAGDAEPLIRQVIKDLPKDDEPALYGRAYNTLGACLEASGDPAKAKAAMMAYLHVDVLYYSQPQEHAEALYRLAKLWKATDADESAKAAELLKSRYGNSSWAKMPL